MSFFTTLLVFFFKYQYLLLILLLQSSQFFLLCLSPPGNPPVSSCPWVVHVSSLVSRFSILFLTSACLSVPTNNAFWSLHHLPFSPASPSQLITLQMIPIPVILFLFWCLLSWFLFLFFRFSCWYLGVCCHFNVHSFDLLFLKSVP